MLGSVWNQVARRGARQPWLHWLRYGAMAFQLMLFLILVDELKPLEQPHPDRDPVAAARRYQVAASAKFGGAWPFLA